MKLTLDAPISSYLGSQGSGESREKKEVDPRKGLSLKEGRKLEAMSFTVPRMSKIEIGLRCIELS